eukprot:3728150-Prorocentrum_lima.AAC.1
MTSSLVGSEMCIRDSAGVGRGGSRASSTFPMCLRSQCCGIAGCSSWPVSYTHLTLPTICSV